MVPQEDYAIALFIVGLSATAVGQVVVNHLVQKVGLGYIQMTLMIGVRGTFLAKLFWAGWAH